MNDTLLILGANSDMAKSYAKLWTQMKPEGRLILASRDLEQLDLFVQKNKLSNAETILFDAVNCATHSTFYKELSNKPTEVLYAAGTMFENKSALPEWSELESMIDVNFKGAASILTIIAEDVDNDALKRIVGISSLAGARVKKSNFLYGMTKAAFKEYLLGLSQFLHDRDVKVQIVEPGFVQTKMTKGLDLKPSLLMKPEDIAELIFKNKRSTFLVPGFKWKIIKRIICLLPVSFIRKM